MTESFELSYIIPSGFFGLPDLDEPENLAATLGTKIDEISAATGCDAQGLRALYGQFFGSLIAEGAVYIGFGYFRADDESASTAGLNIFIKGYSEANAHLVAAQTLEAHSEGGSAHVPGMSATAVELPCGPAVFVMRMTFPPDGVDAPVPAAWQAQAVIPFPKGKRVVVIDLSTPSTAEAPYYAGILDGIARSVRFTVPDDPDAGGTDAEAQPRVADQQQADAPSSPHSHINDVLG